MTVVNKLAYQTNKFNLDLFMRDPILNKAFVNTFKYTYAKLEEDAKKRRYTQALVMLRDMATKY